MPLVVQKYGGTSVASPERIRAVAQRIARTRQEGKQVVVVVSAMGDTTDRLIDLAHQVARHPDERELDLLLSTGEVVSCTLLAMALKDLGVPAISLTGGQAGIRTDRAYGRARITDVTPERIREALAEGKVVVVAGFQGVTEDEDITTLGRGGSDTTAVALAVALGAERCEIYTDVEGIYTADPRVVPNARKLAELDYEEMLELAVSGAKMQPRSIELAAMYNMPVLVASSFTDAPGTLIHGGVRMEARERVRGVAYDTRVARITVLGIPDRPGIAATLFEPLARAGISVDVIVQNVSVEGLTDLSFTVARQDLEKALPLVQEASRQVGARDVRFDTGLAKVAIVGTGMQTSPGYAARMFRALADAGINIEMITTSEIRITCIVREERVKDAVRALHDAFRLDRPDAGGIP